MEHTSSRSKKSRVVSVCSGSQLQTNANKQTSNTHPTHIQHPSNTHPSGSYLVSGAGTYTDQAFTSLAAVVTAVVTASVLLLTGRSRHRRRLLLWLLWLRWLLLLLQPTTGEKITVDLRVPTNWVSRKGTHRQVGHAGLTDGGQVRPFHRRLRHCCGAHI